ncbi:MAG TPA: CBS domain-containing protein [candidate division Zixibacteria bacterium]|nr:CBS domain-containing protein [candidate division Zixibacteria bacterium]
MKVAEVMSTNPICAKVPGTRDDLYELIRKHNLTSFPVIKEESNELIGIITETDIVNKPSETQLALLMTKDPVTTSKSTQISEVIPLLFENNFRQLPVVEKKKLVGMVTIGDIISKVIAMTTSDKTISEYLSSNVLGVWQETPLPVCQKIMEFAGAEAALVFDDQTKMVGIITMVDFVKFYDSISSEKRSEMTAGEGKEGSWDAVSTIIVHTKDLTLPNIPAKEIMTKDVITTFSKATLSDVAKKMHRMELYQMPVVNAKGEVVGMIRDFDLLKAYSEIK